ncbi:ATP-dependent RNA helicase DeaD [Streptomyces tendae]
MLFSATMENEIKTLVDRYLKDPALHEVDAAQGAVTTMSHHILVVKPKDKAPVTAAIASRKGRTIIFVRTQLGADRVAEQLRDAGAKADALHGGMTGRAPARWPTSRTATSTSWSPPTSPPAASTSTASTWS